MDAAAAFARADAILEEHGQTSLRTPFIDPRRLCRDACPGQPLSRLPKVSRTRWYATPALSVDTGPVSPYTGSRGIPGHGASTTMLVDAFLNTVTDNFVIMPPNDPGARGKEAVRDWFNAIFGVFSIAELVFPTTEVNIDHDWAMRHYTYDWTLEPVAGGDSIRDKGDGLYIYHRGSDGEWRISHDIWTSSEPLPGSE